MQKKERNTEGKDRKKKRMKGRKKWEGNINERIKKRRRRKMEWETEIKE